MSAHCIHKGAECPANLFAHAERAHAQPLFAIPAQRTSQESEKDNQAKRHQHEGKRFALSEQTRCRRILPAGEHMVEYGYMLPEPGQESQWLADMPAEDRQMLEAVGR